MDCLFLKCSMTHFLSYENNDFFFVQTGQNVANIKYEYYDLTENGETVRGCAEDFNKTSLCSVDDESKNNCFLCQQDFCNSILYPKTGRLQCHTCSGDVCSTEEDNIEFCGDYSSNERCVSLFSDTEDIIVNRGCLSSFDSVIKNECLSNNSRCLTCSYDGCNKDLSKFFISYCINCNSVDDSNCLKNEVRTEVRCNSDECFTRLLKQQPNHFGQQIERGCLNNVTCDLSENCLSCTGKNCNDQLYPNNRISCYYCENKDCAKGHSSKICNQYSTNEACISYYGNENDVIYRDCYSDIQEMTRQTCDESSNLLCSKCTESLCNGGPKLEGKKCFKCSGISCFNPSLSELVECNSGCFVGTDEQGTTIRDCVDSITCNLNDTSCMTCNDDFCNGIVYPSITRLKCFKCMAENCNGNIEDKSDFCEVNSLSETCVTIFSANGLVEERGCSSSIENKDKCGGNPNQCTVCSQNNCNIHNSLLENFLCVSCNSLSDSTCVLQSNTPTLKACETEKCYSRLVTMENSEQQYVEKGCTIDFPQNFTCNGAQCTSCTEELCNNILYPADRLSCNYCGGNIDCKDSSQQTKICNLYNSQTQACITTFNEKNEVNYRDCYADANIFIQNICDDLSQIICSKCKGQMCNTDITPRGIKCIQCEGLTCFDQFNYPADVIDCTTSCYIGLNEEGKTKRGCFENFNNSTNCDQNGNNDCLLCNNDLCNSIQYPVQNRLSCYNCINDVDNNECLPKDEKMCEIYGENEKCVTVFNTKNDVIERGCAQTILNKVYCNENYKNCLECSTLNCNSVLSKTNLCVFCNSLEDPNCVINPSILTSTKSCKLGCYTRMVGENLFRGCLEDLGNIECIEKNQCSACEGFDKCNINEYPEDRLQCLSCQNASNCLNASSKACIKYEKNDRCVTVFEKCKGFLP